MDKEKELFYKKLDEQIEYLSAIYEILKSIHKKMIEG